MKKKPTPQEALQLMKEGNKRFSNEESIHPHLTLKFLQDAARANQGDYAYATVVACSDSRVPVEAIFDAGVMDLFIVRIAGNVCGTDECGSIEYGLGHVKTPLLVILGHSNCGAVTAAAEVYIGQEHDIERNIPPLLEHIKPAVARSAKTHKLKELAPKGLCPVLKEAVIETAIEENVRQSFYELFLASPTACELVKNGKLLALGALFDIATGQVRWFSEDFVLETLEEAEKSPDHPKEAKTHLG